MRLAGLAWAIGIGAMLGYEAYAILNAQPNDTLSEFVWAYGQHPMVALAVGILIGHFWWQGESKR